MLVCFLTCAVHGESDLVQAGFDKIRQAYFAGCYQLSVGDKRDIWNTGIFAAGYYFSQLWI